MHRTDCDDCYPSHDAPSPSKCGAQGICTHAHARRLVCRMDKHHVRCQCTSRLHAGPGVVAVAHLSYPPSDRSAAQKRRPNTPPLHFDCARGGRAAARDTLCAARGGGVRVAATGRHTAAGCLQLLSARRPLRRRPSALPPPIHRIDHEGGVIPTVRGVLWGGGGGRGGGRHCPPGLSTDRHARGIRMAVEAARVHSPIHHSVDFLRSHSSLELWLGNQMILCLGC
jgi:hypothetical protein